MTKILIILNILLITAAVFLFIKGGFYKKTTEYFNSVLDKKDTYTFNMNINYKIKNEQYMSYEGKSEVVMFGDSHTEMAEWTELLGRPGVINRGISGDITEGMLNRIQSVVKADPKVCFVMGGINDVIRRVSYNKTVENIKNITLNLKQNGVQTVIQSVLFTGELYEDYVKINKSVKELNIELEKFANEAGIHYLDLNSLLSERGKLRSEFSFDGLHLNPEGYRIWRRAVNDKLNTLEF
ncbi:MAG TPA: GDSL-type esterase/lipase family protein [Clostridiales bacterium]|nr:GDSL-type esterase/lipase family protein [Clostridiales bacterium]HQP69954.1 GDSL-type esterase/lipase family protein [Clostridiales bacterium]